MTTWTIRTLPLEYKFTWAITGSSMSKKTGYFVEVKSNGFTGIGEVAGISRGDRETDFVSEFAKSDFSHVEKPEDIDSLDLMAPLRFGMESALVHAIAQEQGKSVWEMFDLGQPQSVPTSISIPILPVDQVSEFINKYDFNRFSSCKIKVGKEHAVESVNEVAKHFHGPLRVDANEAFSSSRDVLEFLGKLNLEKIQFLEQPLPRELSGEYRRLKGQSPIPIVADESVQSELFGQEIGDQFHGINVKLMKAGGYRRAIEQLNKAREMGLKTMLGCMVETSLGISSAMNISQGVDWLDLDGFLILANEPFAMVEENKGRLNHLHNWAVPGKDFV